MYLWAIAEASLECRYMQIGPDNYCYKRDELLAAFVPPGGSCDSSLILAANRVCVCGSWALVQIFDILK